MIVMTFANTISEGHVAPFITPRNFANMQNDVKRLFYTYKGAEGLRFEKGDWIHIDQRLGDPGAEWCMEALIMGALRQGYILKAVALRVFEVTPS